MTRFAIIALISLGTTVYAQIGETKAELARRYGQPQPWGKMLTSHYDGLVDDTAKFEQNGLMILVCFKSSKAVLFMYQRLDKSPMSKAEVFTVLRQAIKKADWVLISGDSPNPRWRSEDSSIFAYYYPEPDFDGAPARFVRVQTAQLDVIYSKLRGEKPYEPPKA